MTKNSRLDFFDDLKAAFPTPEDFNKQVLNMPDYSKINGIVQTQAAKYNENREVQLLEKLNDRGYNLTKPELFLFLTTRCRIEYYERTKLMVLYADEKLICQWYNTIDIQTEFEGENYTVKSTITFGKPPTT